MTASDRATKELWTCKWKHIWRLQSRLLWQGITNTAYILIINNGVLQLESSPRCMLRLSSLLWCSVVSIRLLKPSPSVHCPESLSDARSEETLNDEVARDGGGCWPIGGQYWGPLDQWEASIDQSDHRLTVASSTVMSSGLPPSVSMPAARAFTANGERNWKQVHYYLLEESESEK